MLHVGDTELINSDQKILVNETIVYMRSEGTLIANPKSLVSDIFQDHISAVFYQKTLKCMLTKISRNQQFYFRSLSHVICQDTF